MVCRYQATPPYTTTGKRLVAKPNIDAVTTTGRAPSVKTLELQNFARRLHTLLAQGGMSQSDLARAIWGPGTDPRGYNVAKNRDRIVHYLRGRSLPNPENLRKMAEALGVTPEELMPPTSAAVDDENPAVSISMVGGHPGRAHLVVNKLVSMKLALQIGELLNQEEAETQ
jgi:transcriptional regulator with XRE-family HTH domain